MPIKCTCEYCGDDMMKRPYEVATGKKLFCTRECFFKHKAKNSIKVSLTCDHCRKKFSRFPSAQKGYGRRKDTSKTYCSKKCQSKASATGETFIDYCCDYCNETFSLKKAIYTQGKKKEKENGKKREFYCSKKCFGTANGKRASLAYRDEYTPYRVYFNNSNHLRGKGNKEHLKMKYREIDYDVEFLKTLWESQEGKCAITGMTMREAPNAQGFKKKKPDNGSLDRIDSKKPYRKDNIQFVCVCVNFMKNNFSNDEIINFIERIRNDH